MDEQKQFVEQVYHVLESEETLTAKALELGEIVRLEIEITNISEPQTLHGRTGTFSKVTVDYTLMLETEADIDQREEVAPEDHRRTLRLNAQGKIVGVSDRL
ncbi:MAG: hypothetical protein AAGN35_22775 [Bacteroidota bacterium]